MRKWSNVIPNQIGKALPGNWAMKFEASKLDRGSDGIIDITSPAGASSRFDLQIKSRFEPRDVDALRRCDSGSKRPLPLMLIAPYLSSRSRELLREHAISHADHTGTIWISSDVLFIDRTGASASHVPQQRPRASLRGPITARIVRYLCDMRPPLKVRQIAADTAVNAGNVSRILEFLDSEHLIVRSEKGSVAEIDWLALLRRWSTDLQKMYQMRTFLEPRGTDAVLARLSCFNKAFAITGSFASAQFAPVVEPVAIDLYVRNIDEASNVLGLRESDRIGNVRLIQAFDDVVFERTIERGEVIYACPSQIAADLLTLPKRSTDEFTEFVEWMRQHEADWRR